MFRNGFSLADTANRLQVDHPSLGDYQQALEGYCKQIEEIKTSVPETVVTKIIQGDPSVSKAQKSLYETQQCAIQELQSLIETFSNKKVYISEMFMQVLESGFRVNESKRITSPREIWSRVPIARETRSTGSRHFLD
jgi:hypothetical protein